MGVLATTENRSCRKWEEQVLRTGETVDTWTSVVEQGVVLLDLGKGEVVHIRAGLPCAAPADEEFEGLLQIELRGPVEVSVGAAGV